MKTKIPVCFLSAIFSAITYTGFSVLAYANYPLPFSPRNNWLSDLGNQITNPQGASFYNIGVISCALFLAIWFTAGLAQWRLINHTVQQRLLLISQVGGILTAFALTMSALYPINHPEEHAFWSDVNFILFGISFAFTVAGLRYHSRFPKVLLFHGGAAAILPSMVLLINDAYWLEWLAIGWFILYILAIGIATLPFTRKASEVYKVAGA